MSETAKLLGLRVGRRSAWSMKLAEIADRLVAEYGVPTLGNFRDPVKEIFYILLSAKTTDAQYRATHRRLWTAYPTLDALASAQVSGIRKCILAGGLAGKRARQIQRTARLLLARCGEHPARHLRSMNSKQAFEFIRSLPGMGPKSAFCVMMYSLDADTFPVDVNVQRIAERMGAIPSGFKHHRAQERLAQLAPIGRSKELHIGLVVHGRTICLPRSPKCQSCSLVDLCRRGTKERAQHGSEA
jgi:endonuclease III